MFAKQTQWYLEHRTKIAAFENYITSVREDALPREMANVIKSAAEFAIEKLDQGRGDWTPVGRDEDEGIILLYWSITGAWDHQRKTGTGISVAVSYNDDWLSPDGEPLAVRVWSHVPRTSRHKLSSEKLAQHVSKAVKKTSSIRGALEPDGGWYWSFEKSLGPIITEDALRGSPRDVQEKLTRLFKEFSEEVRPGLEASRKRFPA